MKKKSLIILISVLLIFALILSPLGAYGISLGAMSVYSRMEAEDSYMAQKASGYRYRPAKDGTPL